jgi:site-specific DNA-adenine methylase
MFAPRPTIISDSLAIAMKAELRFDYTSPIKCVGGKYKQVRHLTTLMPERIKHFYEPFGGGLSTTIFLIHTGRVMASNCHVGDLHKPQVNFFRVLQADYERLTMALLESRLWHGNGTRELFNQAVEQINKPDSSLMQAWGLYIFNRLGMLSIRKYTPNSYAPTIIQKGGGLCHSLVLRLPLYGALIQGMDIQERSYTKALDDASKHNGFVFLDPPYEGFDQSMYGVDFDFDDFAERCHAVRDKCSIMITINDSPANRERFKDYQLFTRDVWYGMCHANKGELVICNYKLDSQEYYLNRLGYRVAE